ncbi:hypothetical protein VN0760_14500 [Helicobacter pylori]
MFSDTISKEAHTSEVFESLLNYSNAETNKPWYHYHNMIDIFKRSHYETFWLERQIIDQWGITQNLLANRSKNRYYILGDYRAYDEELAKFYSKNVQSRLKSKNFIVFHLIGSHSLIHSLLPLVGIHTKDEIESKNLFSPKFDAQRKRSVCWGSMDYDKTK